VTVCGLQPAKSVFISWVESVGGYNLGDDEPASKIDQNRPRLTLDPQPFFSTAALTTPRLQKKTGGPLPSPREVSTRVHDFDRRRLSRRATVMLSPSPTLSWILCKTLIMGLLAPSPWDISSARSTAR